MPLLPSITGSHIVSLVYLILQHEAAEGPGRLAAALPGPTRTVAIFRGEPLPGELDGVRGILTLGGEMNLSDPLPWIVEELALLRAAHRAGLPILGVCLGSQLLAAALGGAVERMAQPEVGWLPVMVEAPDPMLEGLPDPMLQFHAHSHAVTRLPPGGLRLLSSAACPVQGWRVGPRVLGLQFHCEWPAEVIASQHDEPSEIHRHYREYDRLGGLLSERIRGHIFGTGTR